MPSVFAQNIVNDEKAGLAKRCKRDFSDQVVLCKAKGNYYGGMLFCKVLYFLSWKR